LIKKLPTLVEATEKVKEGVSSPFLEELAPFTEGQHAAANQCVGGLLVHLRRVEKLCVNPSVNPKDIDYERLTNIKEEKVISRVVG
jgi:hypothetical protein